MTEFRDPPRLSEIGVGPVELGRLLQRAQADVPSETEIEQLIAAVELGWSTTGEPSSGAEPSSSAEPSPGAEPNCSAEPSPGAMVQAPAPGSSLSGAGQSWAGVSVKALLVTGAVGIGLGAWLLVGGGRTEAPPTVPSSMVGASSSGTQAHPAAGLNEGIKHGAAPAVAAATGAGTGVQPTATTDPGASTDPLPEPAGEGSVREAPAVKDPGVSGALRRPSSAARGDTKATAVKSQGADSSGAADEYSLLREARRVVSTNPARAVALTSEHARRFPGGMLTQEREAIAVEALASLGHAGQAQARARRFLSAYPGSPYTTRVEAAVRRGTGAGKGP